MEVGVRGVTGGGSRGEFSQRLTPAVLSAAEGVCVGAVVLCRSGSVFLFFFFLVMRLELHHRAFIQL